VALDFGCHQYFHEHPLEWHEWFRNHLGEEEFNMLAARHRTLAKYVDRQAIKLWLKEEIRKLG